MAFKKCRNNGCEIMIEVRKVDEGWRPFEESGNKHNCQYSDYAKKQREQEQEKNDHGNEYSSPPISPKEYVERLEEKYVDHTAIAKGLQQFKVFSNTSAEILTIEGNEWIKDHPDYHVKLIGQLQLSADGKTFAIAVYYEELKQ